MYSDPLIVFLKSKLDARLFPRVCAALEPFYRHTTEGVYSLQTADGVDLRELKIFLAYISPARFKSLDSYNLLWLSLAAPFPRPAWMTSEEDYRDCAALCLRKNLICSFDAIVRGNFGLKDVKFADPKLHEAFDKSQLKSLRPLLGQALSTGLGSQFATVFADGLETSLLAFLNFSVKGEMDQASSLGVLVKALPNYYPMCELKDQPGTWLVVTA